MFFFFFNDTATTEIYTLSLHDALPISVDWLAQDEALIAIRSKNRTPPPLAFASATTHDIDRKSTRLNSSHLVISYAVFCLKKKKEVVAEDYGVYNAETPQRRHVGTRPS